MIIKSNNKRKYGNFFLLFEAPNDNDDAEVSTEKITKQNGDNELDDIDVDVNEPDDSKPSGQDDVTNQDANQSDDQSDDVSDTSSDDGEESSQVNNDTDDTTNQDDQPEQDNQQEDDIDTDFNGDNQTDDTDGETGDANADPEASPDDDKTNDGPGLEYDSTRKYVLYNKFISLYNSVENYIAKLENSLKDDIQENELIIKSVKYLRNISDLTYDYMIMKFELSSYVQSLMFYQKLVTSIQMVFKLLSEFNKEENAESNTKQ